MGKIASRLSITTVGQVPDRFVGQSAGTIRAAFGAGRASPVRSQTVTMALTTFKARHSSRDCALRARTLANNVAELLARSEMSGVVGYA